MITTVPPITETIDSANAAVSTLFLGHNGEWWDFWLIMSVVFAAAAAIAVGMYYWINCFPQERSFCCRRGIRTFQIRNAGKNLQGGCTHRRRRASFGKTKKT
jgi:hypothetical protein